MLKTKHKRISANLKSKPSLVKMGWLPFFLLISQSVFAQNAKCPIGNIVSIGSSETEIISILGQENCLVGVDQTSDYPLSVKSKPSVGYWRQLSAEGILSLKPQIVITRSDAGPEAVLKQIEGAGIPVLKVPVGYNLKGVQEKIQLIGQKIQAPTQNAISQLNQSYPQIQALVKKDGTPVKVLYIYARGTGTLMAGGQDNAGNALLEISGAQNIIQDFKGYRPITPEFLAKMNPDAILLTQDGLKSLGGIEGMKQIPGVSFLKAYQTKKVIAVDDLLLLGFGPRLGIAVNTVHKELKNLGL